MGNCLICLIPGEAQAAGRGSPAALLTLDVPVLRHLAAVTGSGILDSSSERLQDLLGDLGLASPLKNHLCLAPEFKKLLLQTPPALRVPRCLLEPGCSWKTPLWLVPRQRSSRGSRSSHTLTPWCATACGRASATSPGDKPLLPAIPCLGQAPSRSWPAWLGHSVGQQLICFSRTAET